MDRFAFPLAKLSVCKGLSEILVKVCLKPSLVEIIHLPFAVGLNLHGLPLVNPGTNQRPQSANAGAHAANSTASPKHRDHSNDQKPLIWALARPQQKREHQNSFG
jgi:hypothetical protein